MKGLLAALLVAIALHLLAEGARRVLDPSGREGGVA